MNGSPAGRVSATAAGKDAAAAGKAATEAFHTALEKQRHEVAKWRQLQDKWRKQQAGQHDDGSWIPDWLKSTADTIGNYATAILSNPDIGKGLIETGAGIWGMGAGASMDFAGGALCRSLIGCLAGTPAGIVGNGVIVVGAYGI